MDSDTNTDSDTESTDEIVEELGELIADPRTEAYTFAAIDPDGFVVSYGESDGEEDSYRSICAAVLVQFASASEDDEEQFIKKVIREYNKRKKIAQPNHWGLNDQE